MHPAIEAIEEDAEADSQLLENIADWCLRYTPLVACDPPDGLLLDITGCAHLYGGERALIADLGRTARSRRLCLSSRRRRHHRRCLGGRALRQTGKLRRRRGAQCYWRRCRLPHCGFRPETVASAGARRLETHRRHRRSAAQPPCRPLRHGTAAPARPCAWAASTSRSIRGCRSRLTSPSSALPNRSRARRTCWRWSTRLAGRLQVALERRGDGARRIELTLFRTDGAVRRIAAGCSRPLRDPAQIRALFTERLAALADEFDPGFGFDMARLSVMVAEPCTARTDRHRRQRRRRRARPPGRPPERAAGRATRAPAGRAGQPYPRDRRRQLAGANDRDRCRLDGVSPVPRRG